MDRTAAAKVLKIIPAREIAQSISLAGMIFTCNIHHNTVQRILATHPLPAGVKRRYPRYAQMADGQEGVERSSISESSH